MTPADQKFEEKDLPLILAALHKARQARMLTIVTVKVAHDGGILEIKLDSTEKIK